jgi:hypothetical protein
VQHSFSLLEFCNIPSFPLEQAVKNKKGGCDIMESPCQKMLDETLKHPITACDIYKKRKKDSAAPANAESWCCITVSLF